MCKKQRELKNLNNLFRIGEKAEDIALVVHLLRKEPHQCKTVL